MHCCGAQWCFSHRNHAAASGVAEQFGAIDQLLRDIAQALLFRHRELAQRVVGLVFRDAARLHQQAFGTLHQLALGELQVRICELDLESL